MIQEPATLFCFGLGYTASAFADEKRSVGWRVSGTKRQSATTDNMEVFAFEAGKSTEEIQRAVQRATHLLVSIPPDQDGDPVVRTFGALLPDLTQLKWLGYLSSTAVYGDQQGGWVNEDTQPAPSDDRGRRRLKAETQWLTLFRDFGAPVHIFRIAGIYGPGRSAFEQLKNGRARRVIKPGHAFSRIHRDDIVGALCASAMTPNPGLVVNLADDEPAESAAVIEEACRISGQPLPPEIPFQKALETMSPMARSFWADNRKISNGRLHDLLKRPLKYPTFRSGLRAISKVL